MRAAFKTQARAARPTRRPMSGDLRAPASGEVILETKAAFKTVQRSGWRMCRVCLTATGITLAQGGRLVLEVPAAGGTGTPQLPADFSQWSS